jgi:hypothetical protein
LKQILTEETFFAQITSRLFFFPPLAPYFLHSKMYGTTTHTIDIGSGCTATQVSVNTAKFHYLSSVYLNSGCSAGGWHPGSTVGSLRPARISIYFPKHLLAII